MKFLKLVVLILLAVGGGLITSYFYWGYFTTEPDFLSDVRNGKILNVSIIDHESLSYINDIETQLLLAKSVCPLPKCECVNDLFNFSCPGSCYGQCYNMKTLSHTIRSSRPETKPGALDRERIDRAIDKLYNSSACKDSIGQGCMNSLVVVEYISGQTASKRLFITAEGLGSKVDNDRRVFNAAVFSFPELTILERYEFFYEKAGIEGVTWYVFGLTYFLIMIVVISLFLFFRSMISYYSRS